MTTKTETVKTFKGFDPNALYSADNGALYCGNHLGYSAKTTGRDISGQRIHKVTKADMDYAASEGWTPRCEVCRHRGKS